MIALRTSCLVLVLIYLVKIGISTSIDLVQPSLLTWTDGDSDFKLIVYNLQHIGTQYWKNMGSFPAQTMKASDLNLVLDESRHSYAYSHSQFVHEASIKFHCQSENKTISQGTLSAKSYFSTQSTTTLIRSPQFFLQPMLPKEQDFSLYILFTFDKDPYIYNISSDLFSPTPVCNKYLAVSQELLDQEAVDQQCVTWPAEKIVKLEVFNEKKILNGEVNVTEMQMGAETDLAVSFNFSPSLTIKNLKVEPLSNIKFDLRKVYIDIKNSFESDAQVITVAMKNAGDELVFMKIQCQDGKNSLFSENIILDAKQTKSKIAKLSTTSSQGSQLLIKVTNLVTSQLYQFTAPKQILKDQNSTNTFHLEGSTFTQSSTLSKIVNNLSTPQIIGTAVAVSITIICFIASFLVYRRKKKEQKKNNLNLDSLPTMPSAASDREFVVNEEVIQSQDNVIGPIIDHRIIAGLRVKEKAGTATTLDTENRDSAKDEDSKISDNAPSIQEKMNKRQKQKGAQQQFPFESTIIVHNLKEEQVIKQKKPAVFKSTSRRTHSAVFMLPPPPISDSNEPMESIKNGIEGLEEVEI